MHEKSLVELRKAVSEWVELDEGRWKRLAGIFEERRAERLDTLLLPGDLKYELLFVNKGVLRFYYLDEKGGESNKAFIAEGMFAGPLAASALELPVLYGVQALEETEYLAASFKDFVALFDEDPLFERLGRKLAEWLLTRKELRARSLLQKQAKDRYQEFISRHPDLMARIPQYHIASYLGITEVSLSRLRASFSASKS